MASKIPVTPGSGQNVATYQIGEDSTTKELQRVVASNSTGTELIGASVEVISTGSTVAYTAGEVVGGVLTFSSIFPSGTNSGVLESLCLKFKGSVQTSEFDVAIFIAPPTSTFADNAVPAIVAADSANLIGIWPMTSAQSQLGTHTLYTIDGIAKQVIGSTASLYAVVTTKSTLANLFSTSAEMSLRIGTLW